MSTATASSEWHRLFVAKADGSITPEEHAQLCALLAESAKARTRWFAFQDTEAGLFSWAQREAARVTAVPSAMAPRARWNPGSLGALAAGLVIGAMVWALWPSATPHPAGGSDRATREEAMTSSVAVLKRGVNLVWEGSAPALNAPLSPGTLRLSSGVAEIEFFQGARLCVEGPAEIRLISAGEAFCTHGRFSAEVPPQARGFRLGTPKGVVVDLGTEFGLDLTSASPELHVFKGEVEWHQPPAPLRLLTGGEAAGLEKMEPAHRLAANPAAFVLSRDLDARVVAFQQQAFERWQTADTLWIAEPSLKVRLDFQDPEGSRALRNRAANGEEATGSIVGCTWTQGRWPGKRALQFQSVSDRVRLSVPGEYRQLTLAAWVQLHSLNPGQSALFMCEGWAPGDLHWQILHDGSLCLGIAGAVRGTGDDYISPVVFTPEQLGQWVHLAVVYDTAAGEVRHYVNGARLSQHRLKRTAVLTPNLAELGNWNPAPEWRQRPVRNLVGCLDDFSLCARALSDDEIRTLANDR